MVIGRVVSIIGLLLCPLMAGATGDSFSGELPERTFGLEDIRTLVHQNRSIIIEQYEDQAAEENLSQSKALRLPDLKLDGNGYYSNSVPLARDVQATNAFLYNVSLSSEFEIYTGGVRKQSIERMKKEQQMSGNRYEAMLNEVELDAFILLYDIYRNINYKKFIHSSIELREKEYERIQQLFENGLVLKSDLLRSKLYITDLQRDEVTIGNSIKILSDRFCVMLGLEEHCSVIPDLEDHLHYAIATSFEDMWAYASANAPELQLLRNTRDREQIVLKEITSTNLPHLKAYARYGIGSAAQNLAYHHQLGGEVGLKLTMDFGSFYQDKHRKSSQKYEINKQEMRVAQGEEELNSRLLELYTRYQESLVNIERAEQKIEMSEETTRILRNSYYNQQSLLIDVLESETQAMEASFEWVEAMVDSQKYYWALRYVSGYRG